MWSQWFICVLTLSGGALAWGLPENASQNKLHDHMTGPELERYFGVSKKDDVPAYDVNSTFEHISKRSLTEGFHPSISAFGEELNMKLKSNDDFLTPGFYVETVGPNNKRTRTTVQRGMHFTGHVQGDPNSVVVMRRSSDGMTGTIQSSLGDYKIFPVPAHLRNLVTSPDKENLHLVVKSNPLAKRECQVADDSSHGANAFSRQIRNAETPLKYLEATFIVDHFVYEKHQDLTEIEALVIAAQTSILYLRHSIGEILINFVLNRLIIMKTAELEYGDGTVGNNEKLTILENWAKDNNPAQDSDPAHSDVVVLITSGSGGGMASIGTLCKTPRASAVVNDIGVQTAPNIVHEVGHTMSIGHDTGECADKSRLMAATLSAGDEALHWSRCSRETIQQFLRSDRSHCLDDYPNRKDAPFRAVFGILPGQQIDKNEQCKLQFDETAVVCPLTKNNCASLICLYKGTCVAKGSPMADGTECGPRDWCISGVCQDNGSPPTNGGWTEWSVDYSECSKTCGEGISYIERTCTNPRPDNGGKTCEGKSKMFKICNNKEVCPDAISDRRKQCQSKDPTYIEYYGQDQIKCKLQCVDPKRILHRFNFVEDGSRCTSDKTDTSICIEGVCKPVFCDGSIGHGTAIIDRCGICNGDGESCQIITKLYTKDLMIKTDIKFANRFGTFEILTLPVGAKDIKIEKLEGTYHTIFAYYNGESAPASLTVTRTYYLGVSNKVQYNRVGSNSLPSAEELIIDGPITVPIKIMIAKLRGKSFDVQVTAMMPIEKMETRRELSSPDWLVKEWESCSATCGKGIQTRQVHCYKSEIDSLVNEPLCNLTAKPITEQECNLQACSPEWYVGEWSIPCTKECGKGMQTREVYCRQLTDAVTMKYDTLPDTDCPDRGDDVKTIPCNEIQCIPAWVASEWSQCSKSCGAGKRTRTKSCQGINNQGVLKTLSDDWCENNNTQILSLEEECGSDVCGPFFMFCATESNPATLSVTIKDFDGEQLTDEQIIQQCANEAYKANYPVFAIKKHTLCTSGPDLANGRYAETLDIPGRKACDLGISNKRMVFMYTNSPPPSYKELGCKVGKIKPNMYASFRNQINWANMTRTVESCAFVAHDKGYQMFAVHFFGECYDGTDVDLAEFTSGTDCYQGTGTDKTSYVYTF